MRQVLMIAAVILGSQLASAQNTCHDDSGCPLSNQFCEQGICQSLDAPAILKLKADAVSPQCLFQGETCYDVRCICCTNMEPVGTGDTCEI